MTGFIWGCILSGPFWLIIGWMFFPEPKAVREWWAKKGWARRT